MRLDGIPALAFFGDMIVAVLGTTNQSNQEREDLCTNQREVRAVPHTMQKRKQSHGMINDLDNVDFIPSNVQPSHQEALLYLFEDNEAVIKMIIKLDFWDLIVSVLGNTIQTPERPGRPVVSDKNQKFRGVTNVFE